MIESGAGQEAGQNTTDSAGIMAAEVQSIFNDKHESTHSEVSESEVLYVSSQFYRLCERLVAALGIVFLLPVFFCVGYLVWREKKGPVFYSQTRVGHGAKLFTIYKFRTMRTDAEAEGPFICTSYKDPRITQLGKYLRKCKLDELPQLWNILRGDMAFVGPRPERPCFHQQFSGIPRWQERVSVPPGLTGLAQASKWISHDPEEKLEADLTYIARRSWLLDLRIVFYTLIPKLRPELLFGIRLG